MKESADLAITHEATGPGGRYLAAVAGAAEPGYLEWEPGGTNDGRAVRIATHTVVPRALRGRGVAGALVAQLIADAEREGFLIRPDCSYVAARFAENPGWASLRA